MVSVVLVCVAAFVDDGCCECIRAMEITDF